jgi:hypothetical protein
MFECNKESCAKPEGWETIDDLGHGDYLERYYSKLSCMNVTSQKSLVRYRLIETIVNGLGSDPDGKKTLCVEFILVIGLSLQGR